MTTDREIRTRIAPSPTGDPHIGTAYMALFSYALAKSQGGKFILRIEDTDQTRSTPESEQAILESLRWIGLEWDEGPDVGGPNGPYRQSERTDTYRQHCDDLLEKGNAYRCFCTPERLDKMRGEQAEKGFSGYDGLCASLSPESVKAKMDEGLPCVIRLRMPKEGDCILPDLLRGDVVVPWNTVDDQILMKSDGFPTYHLANVVDDHLMGITHVVRGEEWIPSGPKHLRLYECFGWTPPTFCHLPLLRNPDKSKLSKRKNPTSIFYYRQAGFLPEALLNYLGLMGYSLPSGEEKFSIREMLQDFDIRRVSLGGPIFDVAKLTWLNGRYIREDLDEDALMEKLKNWMLNDTTWKQILPLTQKRLEKLSDLVPMAAFFFADRLDYDPALLIPKKMEGPDVACLLQISLWEFEKVRSWDHETLHQCFVNIAEKEELKIRDVVAPFFVALSGSKSSTPLFETMAILGSDMTRRRVQYAMEYLAEVGHSLSKKKLKSLAAAYEKRYQA